MLKLFITMGPNVGAVARPGTINYTQGQVTLDGRTIAAKKLGNAELSPDSVLQTTRGKAELLLTPRRFPATG
jgi:hypothetical protein